KPHWALHYTETFLELKKILIGKPVLKGPHFNETPFIITMDRCQEGFGAVLGQKHTLMLPSRGMVTAIH
ncbi:hypothetical protein BDR06DRAFT_842122, partial [Suillus hirtellus]